MDLGKAILHAEVDSTGVKSGVDTAQRGFKKLADVGKNAAAGVQKGFKGILSSVFSLKGAFAGLGLGLIAKSFLDAGTQAEKLNVRLQVLLGSADEGDRLFKNMSNFAATVPFQFNEIMESAATLATVVSGGVDEVTKWMPFIADLAAATGIGIQDTTVQVMKMFAAGSGAADMFRERGVLNMLGFKQGVKVAVSETKQIMLDAWESSTSKFRGATDLLANTWEGTMSMLSDQWFKFRQSVMVDSGVLEWMTAFVSVVKDDLGNALNGTPETAAKFAEFIITAMENATRAVSAFIKGLNGVVVVFKALNVIGAGFKDILDAITLDDMMDDATEATRQAAVAWDQYQLAVKQNQPTSVLTALKGEYTRLANTADNALERVTNSLDTQNNSVSNSEKAYDELFNSIDAFSNNLDFEGFLERVRKKLKETTDAKEKAAEATNSLTKATEDGIVVEELSAEQIKKINKELDAEEKLLQKKKDTLESILTKYDPLYAAEVKRKKALEDLAIAESLGVDLGGTYQTVLDGINKEYRKSVAAADAAKKGTNEYAEAFKNVASGIQSAFNDFFYNIFDEGISSFKKLTSNIADLFKKMLAQMATLAIARPIIVPMVTALGGVLGMSQSVQGAVLSQLGVGASSGAGGAIGLAGLAGLFTGNSIGSAFAGLPGFLGGSSAANLGPTYGISQGGLFGNAGSVANWQFGVAGLLGGLGGQALFGGKGGIGGSIGSMIGMATPLGPIGAIIGGLLGGAIGGLFGGSKPKIRAGGATTFGNLKDTEFFDSSLGGVYVGKTGGGLDEHRGEFGDAIAKFDDAIAKMLDEDQLGKVSDAVANWNLRLKGDAISIDAMLEGRFSAILGTFNSEIRNFVSGENGLENQVNALHSALTAEKLLSDNPELFGDLLLSDFLSAAKQFQNEEEDLTASMMRLVTTVQAVTTLQKTLKDISSGSVLNDFEEALRLSQRSMHEVLSETSSQINDFISNFDGSAEQLSTVVTAVQQRYQMELQMLGRIRQVSEQINGLYSGLEDTITRQVIGDKAYYDKTISEAYALQQTLSTETDPEKILAISSQIEQLLSTAYGLQSSEDKITSGPGFLAFIQETKDLANRQLEVAKTMIEDQINSDQIALEDFVSRLEDPLTMVTGFLKEIDDTVRGIADNNNGSPTNPDPGGDGVGPLNPFDQWNKYFEEWRKSE